MDIMREILKPDGAKPPSRPSIKSDDDQLVVVTRIPVEKPTAEETPIFQQMIRERDGRAPGQFKEKP